MRKILLKPNNGKKSFYTYLTDREMVSGNFYVARTEVDRACYDAAARPANPFSGVKGAIVHGLTVNEAGATRTSWAFSISQEGSIYIGCRQFNQCDSKKIIDWVLKSNPV